MTTNAGDDLTTDDDDDDLSTDDDDDLTTDDDDDDLTLLNVGRLGVISCLTTGYMDIVYNIHYYFCAIK